MAQIWFKEGLVQTSVVGQTFLGEISNSAISWLAVEDNNVCNDDVQI